MPNSNSDFSQGSVVSSILRLAGTITLASLINVLYSIVDRIYLGHMPGSGTLALTGVGLAFPIICVITAFQNLCATGAAPLFAMARGKRDQAEAERILGNAFSMLLVMGIALTAIGYLVKTPVLRITGASADTYPYANEYLHIYLIGTVFTLVGLGLNPLINGQGFAMTGMLTVLMGAVINILLDPLLIFALDMGVRGAALATIIAQACSAIWVFCFFTGKRALQKLRLSCMRPDWPLIRRIATLGSSGFIMSVTNGAVGMVYNAQLQLFGGDMYLGAMSIINTLRELVEMPANGLRSGALPVISYNYGAGLYSRVRACVRVVLALCVLIVSLLWLILMLFPGQVLSLFNGDPALLSVGIPSLRTYYAAFCIQSLMMTGQTFFLALGMSKQAVFFSMLRKVGIVIPLILLLPRVTSLGASGIFYAEPVSEIIAATACFTTMLVTLGRALPKEDRPL